MIASRTIAYTVIHSRLGRLLVAATERGVCRILRIEGCLDPTGELRREFPYAPLERDASGLRIWGDALLRYVEGEADRLELPLDVGLSRVQRRILDPLRPRSGGTPGGII